MSQKIFGNNLVVIRKSKVALMLNKPACIGMCILEFSNILIFEFHYDYIKDKYDSKSKVLFTDTARLMCETKSKEVYEDFSSDKEMF